VELRSLNNRYFKSTIRLPDQLAALEPELESQLRNRINRGSVSLSVSYKDTSAAAAYEINEAALERYLSHLEIIEKRAKREVGESGVTIDLGSLLALPGIVQQPDQTELLQRARPVVRELVEKAIEKMLTMRDAEGGGLAADLQHHCRFIMERLGQIQERAPLVVEEYHVRLRNRVDMLLARAKLELEAQDLMKEVAIYAERCDISEECQRLRAHLEQVQQIVGNATPEPAGRTLDFISQELLREANTIASKSNDAAIARMTVEIKGAIDRLKEQVQNVE
jgi:uncharacterized protein (TIGR00255 family)